MLATLILEMLRKKYITNNDNTWTAPWSSAARSLLVQELNKCEKDLDDADKNSFTIFLGHKGRRFHR